MVVEKLIPKKEEYVFPNFDYVDGRRYRHICGYCSRTMYVRYEYWYDGRLFFIGDFEGGLCLVEPETGSFAVRSSELKKKPTVKQLIQEFKSRLGSSGFTIHELIQRFKSWNLDLEPWLISSLNI